MHTSSYSVTLRSSFVHLDETPCLYHIRIQSTLELLYRIDTTINTAKAVVPPTKNYTQLACLAAVCKSLV